MRSVQDDWKSYDDFAQGIDANRLPATEALAGTRLGLSLAGGGSLQLAFQDASTAAWRSSGPDGERSGTDWYEAIEVDEATWFIDLTFASSPREALTVIASRRSRRALTVRSEVAEEQPPGEPQVGQRFLSAVVAGAPGDPEPAAEEPAPTRDLVGRRALYRYSPNHVYEHVYLSTQRYCWQCLAGVQRGHGDCDLASTWRFGEGRYVFAFREFRIPVASVFFYNMNTLRSTGKFLGVTSDGAIENSPAGAHILPLGKVDYPEDFQPV